MAETVVIDASAALRTLQSSPEKVGRLLAREMCIAPELIRLEVANGLSTAAKAGRLDPGATRRLFAAFLALPIEVVASEPVVTTALDVSMELQTSVYDAVYLVLAHWRDALLLTADRRLASLARRAELVE